MVRLDWQKCFYPAGDRQSPIATQRERKEWLLEDFEKLILKEL